MSQVYLTASTEALLIGETGNQLNTNQINSNVIRNVRWRIKLQHVT